ncbi:hypothetical protein [Novosphingobium sp.]|uniref:hypothetical protein n=1 Tax=Novosphingobium sp. TaxID=1874826 RepID=UPI001ED0FEEC|nr:hypothetical protein [Novosphingobium sp.]MBK6803225.1 hypothetical protein [Novosphingobium sp.]MBK9011923.1 hypothetical protein [Novosphingobium sp.]
MTDERQAMSAQRMAALLGGAAALAALIVVGAVLPAEFNRDPLGIGRATGIAALWAPDEVRIDPAAGQLPPASVQRGAIRTLEIEIPLGAGGDPAGKDQLEYKVRLPRGGAMLYSWQAEGAKAADEFYAEFHGHTLAEGDKMTVAEYRKESETANSGALTAAFDGIHGWYFLNTSERPVKVRLKVTGFFEPVPPGAPGNEAGLTARLGSF